MNTTLVKKYGLELPESKIQFLDRWMVTTLAKGDSKA